MSGLRNFFCLNANKHSLRTWPHLLMHVVLDTVQNSGQHLTSSSLKGKMMQMGPLGKSDNWGKRLTKVLREKNLSFRKAATLAGVAPSVINSWSGGASPSNILAVKRLCDALDISFTWLLTGSQEKHRSHLPLTEFFDGELFFDGLARIRIEKLFFKKQAGPHERG